MQRRSREHLRPFSFPPTNVRRESGGTTGYLLHESGLCIASQARTELVASFGDRPIGRTEDPKRRALRKLPCAKATLGLGHDENPLSPLQSWRCTPAPRRAVPHVRD